MTATLDSKILDWYLGLHVRTLDLVGDYAGSERFLLEGDSLLLHCFGDPRIDFEDGFQLLHAVYVVEHFLEALVRRQCNFHLVFFSDHEDLCIPPHKSPLRNFFLLTRSVIIRHLTCHLPKSHPGIEIHNFSSVRDGMFKRYLESIGIYFIMCHDGAHAPVKFANKNSMLGANDEEWQKVAFRKAIRHFISSGFNVALINGLEVRDTKVMAMIVEGRHEDDMSSTENMADFREPTQGILDTKMCRNEPPDRLTTILRSIALAFPDHGEPESPTNVSLIVANSLTERLNLVAFTLSQLLAECPARAPLASAFLLHAILLSHIPLSTRRMKGVELADNVETGDYRQFLSRFATVARAAVDDRRWKHHFDNRGAQCDVADLVDGRLFKMVLFTIQGRLNVRTLLPKEVIRDFDTIADLVESYDGVQLQLSKQHHLTGHVLVTGPEQSVIPYLLRFSNVVLDHHLASIKIDVNVRDSTETEQESARIFREITHWHNSQRPIDRMKEIKIYNDKQRQRQLRSNQRYMNEMVKYAASLTNASGKILNPQTITVQKETKHSSCTVSANSKKAGGLFDNRKSMLGGKRPTAGKKELFQADISSRKATADAEKVFSSWVKMRETFDKIVEPEARYQGTSTYFQGLSADKVKTLNAEISLYNLQTLLEIWSRFCEDGKREEGYKIAALIWNQLRRLWEMKSGLTKTIATNALGICRILGFLTNEVSLPAIDRPLTFSFRVPRVASDDLSIRLLPQEFQLLHCGPYMDRDLDSRPDARVPFDPDGWQRAILDELDANRSVFVVAPTSAGKTFISFYAMEKILREGDDGVLVYVAPTKALVNQIGAEVQARFSKKYKHGGKSVWAIHTRDYRVNNPAGCQILVTVPHILQIMLLAPSNAKSWAPRVKRIIFDEIHSIGQAQDGVVWEQLLLLAPCPIIALSATVGNPEQFNDWLLATQRSSGFELTMIQHQHRYSDLRKFVYKPPTAFVFEGLQKGSTLGDVSLDGTPGFQFFHPIASLINKSRGIPEDLTLEARDCLTLWQTMVRHQTPEYRVPEDLHPRSSCPQTIAKRDVIAWEKELKKLLSLWMTDSNSPFNKLLQELSTPLEPLCLSKLQVPSSNCTAETRQMADHGDLCKTALPLVTDLHKRNALPAILFNYDRSACEDIAKKILSSLQRAEESWKKTSPKWKSLMQGYDKWLTTETKTSRPLKSKNKSENGERLSKADIERESAELERTRYDFFDPNAPCEEFSFADMRKVEKSEMEEYFKRLQWNGVASWLMAALTRGIGIHHAGMNRKYRQAVEILFRKGYLRVVIATGTLALGINMPCKTVVFIGDSVFLTALNFRQCAGRAGRRGFDILGNIVFHGIPIDKVCRLLSSRLPDLNGHFPMTTTLVLRLFTLLYESKNSTYARQAINSMLSQPRLYLGGESFKDQVMHHVRFSIEYLRRQRLLGPNGEPINFTSCVSHLYFTENSSFAFHALLKAGYFHSICEGIHEKPRAVLHQLILVMAHLFGRRPCRQSDAEFVEKIVKKSPSVVFLPELPKQAAKILQEHNRETLETFTTYVTTFAKQNVTGDDRTLPLTRLQVGGSQPTVHALQSLPATTARSHFVALSGHSDTFTSISDLCSSARAGIFLEKSVIPQLDIPSTAPLNAYLYDFFMHGAVEPLQIANGIRRGDIWFLLNDFSLVLATIVTSLANFLKVKPTEDGEMVDIAGAGDVMEEDVDEKEEPGRPSDMSSKLVRANSPTPSRKAHQKKAVPDSWDGSDCDSQEDVIGGEEEASTAGTSGDWMDADGSTGSSSSSSEGGLRNVLSAMQMLKMEFDEKFKAMWA